MATVSIRQAREDCLGPKNTISVKRDLFQYRHGPIDLELRVRRHIELVKDTAIDVHAFLVGHDPGYTGWWTQEEALQAQHAIGVMRDLYAQIGLGVRTIDWRYIPVSQAGGYQNVTAAQTTDLTEEFSGPGPGIDLFFVKEVIGAGGFSNSSGPCNKNQQGTRTGSVQETGTNLFFNGILLAHEVGHYLRLRHSNDEDDITNVMGHDSDGDGIGLIDSTSTNLTQAQLATILSDPACFIRPPC